MLLDSALLTACTYKHKETIKYLIENGAPIQKCLCRAAINGTSQDLLEYFDNYQGYIDVYIYITFFYFLFRSLVLMKMISYYSLQFRIIIMI